jgi:AcrR family transcriptional regulator
VNTSARSLGGVSARARTEDRRRRLLDAALDVVGERGVADFTMTAVCRSANLTERYFYESFTRREDLLTALFDGVAARALDRATHAADAVAPAGLERRARAAVGAVTRLLAEDPRAARLYREAVGHPGLAARRQDTVTAFAAFLADLVTDEHPALHGRDDLVVDTVVLTGGIVEAVGAWLDGRLPVAQDALVGRCTRLVVAAARQLATEHPPTASGSRE